MIDVFPCLLLSGQTTQGYYLLEHGICKTKCTFVRVKVDKKLRLVLQLTYHNIKTPVQMYVQGTCGFALYS